MAIDALHALSSIVPFRFLMADELSALVMDSSLMSYASGDEIIRQGDAVSDEVFVLLEGSVESVDVERIPPFRLNVIDSGSYFGERSCLFGIPRLFAMRALEASTCLVIPGPRFLALLAASRPFAQAFGTKLREGLGLFEAFDRFNSELARAVGLGHIEIRRLVELYKALEPALHPSSPTRRALTGEPSPTPRAACPRTSRAASSSSSPTTCPPSTPAPSSSSPSCPRRRGIASSTR